MTPEQYIEQQITGGDTDTDLARRRARLALTEYRRHEYEDVEHLITRHRDLLIMEKLLAGGCTSKAVSFALEVSWTSARKRLQYLVASKVARVDRSVRPFIFSLR